MSWLGITNVLLVAGGMLGRMDKSLSEQQEMLLFKACKDKGGTLPVKMAEDLYSSKSSARSAIDKLRMFGYIELKTPGYFSVVKLPSSIKRELKALDSEDSLDDVDSGDDSGSEFVAEPVDP